MESFEHQEERAREHLNIKAVIRAALLAGIITYILPGGPWMSQEGFYAIMGREVNRPLLVALPLHLLLSLLYGFSIAAVIYSLPTFIGIIVGALLAFPLAAANMLLFRAGLGFPANEPRVLLCHVMFALFFSTVYRALAVPRPAKN